MPTVLDFATAGTVIIGVVAGVASILGSKIGIGAFVRHLEVRNNSGRALAPLALAFMIKLPLLFAMYFVCRNMSRMGSWGYGLGLALGMLSMVIWLHIRSLRQAA